MITTNDQAVTTGTTTLNLTVPAGVNIGTTYARFRICSVLGEYNAPSGLATDGEVEDYVINIAPVADMEATKDLVTTAPFVPGQAIEYSIVVTNNGPDTANNIQVVDTPSNQTITSVSSTKCNAFPCTIPSLINGAFEVITVTATINSLGTFDNTVTVSADEFDPDLTNNTDNTGNDGTAVNPANVNVVKSVDAGPDGIASAAETLTYTILFTNTGDIPQNYAVGDIGEIIQANTTHTGGDDFTCAAVTAGSSCSNTNAFIVPAGGSFSLTFIVTVDDPLPAGVISIANYVTVPGECPNVGGSTNDCDVVVETQPGITVFKTVDAGADGIASAGETITYSITFNNTGGTVQDYAVGDIGETVPANTSHAGGDDFTCTAVAAGSACSNTSAFSVPVGGSFLLTYLVTVVDPLPAGVTPIANSVTVPGECPNVGTDNDCDVVVVVTQEPRTVPTLGFWAFTLLTIVLLVFTSFKSRELKL